MYKINKDILLFDDDYNGLDFVEIIETYNDKKNIVKINFGQLFNQDISFIPHYITHITFGECFNQDISFLSQNISRVIFDKYSKLFISIGHRL